MSKKKDIEELRWIRLFSPVHIPKSLIEQVKNRDYSVNDFFKYQELNCLVQEKGVPTLNPLNHLYALADDNYSVHGVLWFIIDPLSKALVINIYSVHREYWEGSKGKPVKRLATFMQECMKKLKIDKIYWLTDHPKHSEKHGFKRTRTAVMEFKGEEDGKNDYGGSQPQGECEHADTGAAEHSESDVGKPGG